MSGVTFNREKGITDRRKAGFKFADFCVVCGAARLDPDPTGVTCGDPRCLAELGKDRANEEKEWHGHYLKRLRKIAEDLGLEISSSASIDTILEKISYEANYFRDEAKRYDHFDDGPIEPEECDIEIDD